MSDWPPNMTIAPIREWPGNLTPPGRRQVSKFTVRAGSGWSRKPTPLSSTLGVLDTELSMLKAKGTELLVAIAASDFRLDGKPRATARAEHPGVILSFDSKVGHLSYPCDTFTTWQDNLRAIALALEALRKVDRYGVTTHGEQYRGFLEIEAPKPGYLSSIEAAVHYLEEFVGADRGVEEPSILLRRAQRRAHPDVGGVRETWDALQEIESLLRANGLLK